MGNFHSLRGENSASFYHLAVNENLMQFLGRQRSNVQSASDVNTFIIRIRGQCHGVAGGRGDRVLEHPPQIWKKSWTLVDGSKTNINREKGTWRIGRAPDYLANHACVPGSNQLILRVFFQRNIPVSSFSMWLGDHVNGGLVESRLKPECIEVNG